MSISGGALESVSEFLTEILRDGKSRRFPWWDLDSGRWALAHYAGIQQAALEEPGIRHQFHFSSAGRQRQLMIESTTHGIVVRPV
jgi:hypothetical protein